MQSTTGFNIKQPEFHSYSYYLPQSLENQLLAPYLPLLDNYGNVAPDVMKVHMCTNYHLRE